MSILKRMFPEI